MLFKNSVNFLRIIEKAKNISATIFLRHVMIYYYIYYANSKVEKLNLLQKIFTKKIRFY